jgi:ornithine cyclodeaminase/alanine dehydrogenase-like protein (mu-crystallin family)
VLVLDATAVRRVLTPALARAAAEAAFLALRDDTTQQPLRTQVAAPQGTMLVKPAASALSAGVKVVSIARAAVPPIQGFVALLDPATGELSALLDGAAVTELRTAAASALATGLLARADARRLGILGGGVQARAHLRAMHALRAFDDVLVWSRSGAESLLRWADENGLPARAASDAGQVVRESEVVCTVTSSPTPVLRGEWLQPGTHVNAVGAFRPDERELDSSAVRGARVVVDSHESAAREAGAVLLARAEGVEVEVVGELVDVLLGALPGRTSDEQVTVFSSTGLAVQDLTAAQAAVTAARTAGEGVEVPFP